MANPGPASSSLTNAQTLTTQQALRLLAVAKGLSVNAAGDVVLPLLSVTSFVAATVITTNANVPMATATVGIYTAPAAGGTAVLTTVALTGQTTQAFAYVRPATSAAAQVTVSNARLYVNIGTAVAGGTVDLYLYGYDVS